jgi:hypothetical protein
MEPSADTLRPSGGHESGVNGNKVLIEGSLLWWKTSLAYRSGFILRMLSPFAPLIALALARNYILADS